MNYNLEMEKQMSSIREGSTLLLHACCAPCSTACLERLADFFKVVIFYYNPNITEKDEYDKRIEEIKKLISLINPKYKVELIEGNYEPELWFRMAKGLELEKERGRRCYKCYKLRMEETFKYGEKHHYDYCATIMSISNRKNALYINEIGEELQKKYPHIKYLYADFKKADGITINERMNKELNLYHQNYCGCKYSIR